MLNSTPDSLQCKGRSGRVSRPTDNRDLSFESQEIGVCSETYWQFAALSRFAMTAVGNEHDA